jgi:hypothetical protein
MPIRVAVPGLTGPMAVSVTTGDPDPEPEFLETDDEGTEIMDDEEATSVTTRTGSVELTEAIEVTAPEAEVIALEVDETEIETAVGETETEMEDEGVISYQSCQDADLRWTVHRNLLLEPLWKGQISDISLAPLTTYEWLAFGPADLQAISSDSCIAAGQKTMVSASSLHLLNDVVSSQETGTRDRPSSRADGTALA